MMYEELHMDKTEILFDDGSKKSVYEIYTIDRDTNWFYDMCQLIFIGPSKKIKFMLDDLEKPPRFLFTTNVYGEKRIDGDLITIACSGHHETTVFPVPLGTDIEPYFDVFAEKAIARINKRLYNKVVTEKKPVKITKRKF